MTRPKQKILRDNTTLLGAEVRSVLKSSKPPHCAIAQQCLVVAVRDPVQNGVLRVCFTVRSKQRLAINTLSVYYTPIFPERAALSAVRDSVGSDGC